MFRFDVECLDLLVLWGFCVLDSLMYAIVTMLLTTGEKAQRSQFLQVRIDFLNL